jgi:hypothetical protein
VIESPNKFLKRRMEMINKNGESYKLTEVKQYLDRKVIYRLKEPDWLTLTVGPDTLQRRTCGNCGLIERPDIYSVQAVLPDKVWICDFCAAKFCPELLSEAERLRGETYERDWGISKEEQEEHNRRVNGGKRRPTECGLSVDKPDDWEVVTLTSADN